MTLHNMVGHPLSEVAHLAGFPDLSEWIHDVTIPSHVGFADSTNALADEAYAWFITLIQLSALMFVNDGGVRRASTTDLSGDGRLVMTSPLLAMRLEDALSDILELGKPLQMENPFTLDD